MSTEAKQPMLRFCIKRSNGILVPLIPADELPASVRLHGVPRILNTDQTSGLHCIGTMRSTGLTFELDDDDASDKSSSSTATPASRSHSKRSSKATSYLAPDHLARLALNEAKSPQQNANQPAPTVSPKGKAPVRSPPEAVTVLNNSTTERSARVAGQLEIRVPPSGRFSEPWRKVYCTHWIIHGFCSYAQTGCRYKHEIPEDEETLAEVFGIDRERPPPLRAFRPTTRPQASPRFRFPRNKNMRPGKRGNRQSASGSVSSVSGSSVDGSNGKANNGGKAAATGPNKMPVASRSAPIGNDAVEDGNTDLNSAVGDLIDFSPYDPAVNQSTASTDKAKDTTEGANEKQKRREPIVWVADTEGVLANQSHPPTRMHIGTADGKPARAAARDAKKVPARNKDNRPIEDAIKHRGGGGLMDSQHAPSTSSAASSASKPPRTSHPPPLMKHRFRRAILTSSAA